MPLGFHPHRYVALVGARAIVLDVAADRYRRLSPELSAAVAHVLASPAAPAEAVVAKLLAHGLLVDGAASRSLERPTHASRPAPRSSRSSPRALTFGDSAAAMIGARHRLRSAGLQQSLADAAGRAGRAQVEDETAACALAGRFAVHRAWLPLTPKCLPDSLALHTMLCRSGIAARLVIGVRDQPFAAHCWVEAGTTILSDPLETVAELSPILVL